MTGQVVTLQIGGLANHAGIHFWNAMVGVDTLLGLWRDGAFLRSVTGLTALGKYINRDDGIASWTQTELAYAEDSRIDLNSLFKEVDTVSARVRMFRSLGGCLRASWCPPTNMVPPALSDVRPSVQTTRHPMRHERQLCVSLHAKPRRLAGPGPGASRSNLGRLCPGVCSRRPRCRACVRGA